MLIIPLGTDAPIYYWPRVTVGLIVLNSLIFLGTHAVGAPEENVEPWMLAIGAGLHPIQWLTHHFLHADLFHLIGNMIFLWAFGLIVEGKLGPFRFLAVYLGVCFIDGAIVQAAFLDWDETFALGASGVIYALLAITLIWAPFNELNCFYFFFFGFRVFTGIWDLPIYGFVLFYIVWDVLMTILTGFQMSSEVLHTSGAVVGLAVGLLMLKLGWVDCEEYDALTRLKRWFARGRESGSQKSRPLDPDRAKQKARRSRSGTAQESAGSLSIEDRRADALRRIQTMVQQGMPLAALEVHRKAASNLSGWSLPEADQLALIKALHQDRAWTEAAPLMRDLIHRQPGRSGRLRLRLAQIYLKEQERPMAATRLLQGIPEGSLPEDLEKVRRQLAEQARQMLEEGVLELEEDD
ncbi:rhomboid family intramembrane serine protease [soil metagenome]